MATVCGVRCVWTRGVKTAGAGGGCLPARGKNSSHLSAFCALSHVSKCVFCCREC